MRTWCLPVLSTVILLGALRPLGADPLTPGTNPVFPAHLAWRVDPLALCPHLRVADDGPLAVVVFHVDVAGKPSHASIRVSSQSEQLDAAALSCVLKLRFQPATRPGDAEAVDSWQQMAWRWAAPATAPAAAAPPPLAAAVPVTAVPQEGASTLRVCANEAGQLIQAPSMLRSSGDPTLDAAALNIAKSGSGSYRPEATLNGKPLSGCAQVTIRFETR
jgi:TonB family protein